MIVPMGLAPRGLSRYTSLRCKMTSLTHCAEADCAAQGSISPYSASWKSRLQRQNALDVVTVSGGFFGQVIRYIVDLTPGMSAL